MDVKSAVNERKDFLCVFIIWGPRLGCSIFQDKKGLFIVYVSSAGKLLLGYKEHCENQKGAVAYGRTSRN